MTREEFMDIVYSELHSDGDNNRANRIIDAADEYADEQTRWILCSERLPEAGEYVGSVSKYYLVQNEYGDMLVARYTNSGYWEYIYHYTPCDDEIVAWMQLPEPLAEGSEE